MISPTVASISVYKLTCGVKLCNRVFDGFPLSATSALITFTVARTFLVIEPREIVFPLVARLILAAGPGSCKSEGVDVNWSVVPEHILNVARSV